MYSLLQVEDVSNSETMEDDGKHANMKGKKEQEWRKGRTGKNSSQICEEDRKTA